jgi:hypothetical protein
MTNLRFLVLSGLMAITTNTFSASKPIDDRVDIWPTIPFVRGADLCNISDAYGQTRNEYMDGMVRRAQDLMYGGAYGVEALSMLREFNSLYDRNQALATRYQYLDVTLESTLKAYLDSYYRNLRPKVKKVSFQNVNDLLAIVRATSEGQRDGGLNREMLLKLDYIAYGTYAMGPNCRGDIQVTLHLVGRDGSSESFVATGQPGTVMSKIATEIFSKYQRTQFPAEIKVGSNKLTIVGGLNNSVDEVSAPELAEEACATLEARLPTRLELELIDSYGDWSGGVTLGEKAWAMPNGKVYHPLLRNPSPVRERWEVNDKTFLYYCVR